MSARESAVLVTLLLAGCDQDPATLRLDGAPADGAASGGLDEYAFLERQSVSQDELPRIWADLPCERIGMSRLACNANCPVYDITLIRGSSDETRARVLYTGHENVDRAGEHEGTVGLRSYARLCQLVDQLGFVELESEYRAPWDGDAAAIVRVSHATGAYEVLDYANQGPPELVALELAIDGTTGSATWEP
jgi:hypothetical protein